MNHRVSRPRPRLRPDITRGITQRVALGCNRHLYITLNKDEDGLCEVFLHVGRSGGCIASHCEAVGRLVSLALRSGVSPEEVIDQLRGIRCPNPAWYNGTSVLSCADAVAQMIAQQIEAHGERVPHHIAASSQMNLAPECPECGGMLQLAEGCMLCPACGYSQCG